ncbi:MAG TPA: hypothetical protein VKA55_11110 [Gammaproteobacteria bacterium]|nr:hypothetical protein [Gammaproteobacteria bacterium]
MRIPGGLRIIPWLAALALFGLAGPASGQTVTGPVNSVSEEHITVDGTRFLVNEDTVIQTSPADNKTVPFAPGYLGDVWRVRVTGTGRLAERVVVLPYKPEGGEAQ